MRFVAELDGASMQLRCQQPGTGTLFSALAFCGQHPALLRDAATLSIAQVGRLQRVLQSQQRLVQHHLTYALICHESLIRALSSSHQEPLSAMIRQHCNSTLNCRRSCIAEGYVLIIYYIHSISTVPGGTIVCSATRTRSSDSCHA